MSNVKRKVIEALLQSDDWTGSWGMDRGDVVDDVAQTLIDAGVIRDDADVVTEHATAYKSGDMKIRYDDPEIEAIYPLAQWIVHNQRFGGKVYRRRVIVVDGWEEVPRAEAGSGGLEVEG